MYYYKRDISVETVTPRARSSSQDDFCKVFSLLFPVSLTLPSQDGNGYSQLKELCPQGARNTLFGPKIRYNRISCHNRRRSTILGRKHFLIVGKAIVYDLLPAIQFRNLSHYVPKMMKKRPPV